MPQVQLVHGPCDGGMSYVADNLKQVVVPLKDYRQAPSAAGYRLAVYCEAFQGVWCFAGYEDERKNGKR